MTSALSLAPITERKHSVQTRAVPMIFSAEPKLMTSASPFINLATETIMWDEIFRIPLASEGRAARLWAYSIWTDNLRPRTNCFDAALLMTPNLQAAVLKALALRWGIAAD